MKNKNNTLKKLSKSFNQFMKKGNAYKIISQVSILVIILSVLSLAYIIDNAATSNSLLTFILVIVSLYFIALAGSLWIFSKFRSIGLMKTIFLKNTALAVSIIGLLIIFKTLGSTQDLGMIEIFFLLIGTAIPLTIGKMIWDLTKDIEDDYEIKKIEKSPEIERENKANETFILMQEYKEEMAEESEEDEED